MVLKEITISLVMGIPEVTLTIEDQEGNLGMNQGAHLGTSNLPNGVIRALMILDVAGILGAMMEGQISEDLLETDLMAPKVS